MAVQAPCRLCGRTFKPYGSRRRVHCKRCTARLDAEVGRDVVMPCNECGKAFTARNRTFHYCSDACRTKTAARRNREYMRRYMSDPEKRAMAIARSRAWSAASRSSNRKRQGLPPSKKKSQQQKKGRPPGRPNASKSTACRLCGRAFKSYGGSYHSYCKRCSDKSDLEISTELNATCKVCGGTFPTTRRNACYCSDACRTAGRRRRNNEYLREYLSDPEKSAARLARSRAWSAARRSEGHGGAARAG